MSVEITVQGTFTAYQPPQRATVRLRVGLEGARALVICGLLDRDLDCHAVEHVQHRTQYWVSSLSGRRQPVTSGSTATTSISTRIFISAEPTVVRTG